MCPVSIACTRGTKRKRPLSESSALSNVETSKGDPTRRVEEAIVRTFHDHERQDRGSLRRVQANRPTEDRALNQTIDIDKGNEKFRY